MDSRRRSISGAFRGSATCVIMLSKAARGSATIFQPLSPVRIWTIGPCRSTSVVEGRSVGPCQMHSRLISGSRWKAETGGNSELGRPRSIAYPKSSLENPSRRLTTCLRLVPWTGYSPCLTAREMDSGPCPNGGLKSALKCKRGDDAPLRCIDQKPQRSDTSLICRFHLAR
jgi:hypothetical protein